jgi:hypothetical protein
MRSWACAASSYVLTSIACETALCGWLQAVMEFAKGLRQTQEAVVWCKERTARIGHRADALVPALQELKRAVFSPEQDVELRLVESLSVTLVLLAKVHWSHSLHQCPPTVPLYSYIW